MPLNIVKVPAVAQARRLRDLGFCPVECVFAEEVVYDDLRMAHHGPLSSLEAPALRAYRDHFGARSSDPRFVVANAADSDATFAIAALSGALPRGLDELARLIHRVDTDPISVSLLEEPEGGSVLWWRHMAPRRHDEAAFYEGVGRWFTVAEGVPCGAFSEIKSKESARIAVAESVPIEQISSQVAFVESPIFRGWDVWYRTAPVVALHWTIEGVGRGAIGCRNPEAACELFGPQGLVTLCARLRPEGWRGKAAIIGAAAGADLSPQEVRVAAELAAESISS